MENEPVSTFDLLQKVLRNINELRLTDTPMNTLAMAYKEGYDTAIDDAMNIIRREL
jgi:hypothetical protein